MAGFSDFHNDPTIRFDHTPITSKFAFALNHVGAHDSDDIDVAPFTPADTNSIFVNDTTGNDTTGDGTQSTPYKTILKGIDSTTALLTYVVITDSVLYAEDLSSATTTFFQGLYALSGQTPTWTSRLLGYTPADANSIFFGATSGTPGGVGTQADPSDSIAGAVSLTDGTHQNIVEVDGDTYTEDAIEMTGNFLGMYAADGVKPTFQPVESFESSDYTDKIQITTETSFGSSSRIGNTALLTNGLIICSYADSTDGDKGKFSVINSDGSLQSSGTQFKGASSTFVNTAGLSTGGFVICYTDTSGPDDGNFVIYNNSLSEVVSETQFESGQVTVISVAGLDNGLWVCCYTDADDSSQGKFIIRDEDGNIISSPTVFETGTTSNISVAKLTNGDWVCCYRDEGDSYKGKFVIYQDDGTLVVGPTQFEPGNTRETSVVGLNNDTWVCCYRDVGAADGKFVIIENDGTPVSGPTQFESGEAFYPDVSLLNNTSWICAYRDDDDTGKGKYVIREEDGTSIIAPIVFNSASTLWPSLTTMESGNFCLFYNELSNVANFIVWYPYSWTGLKVSAASNINGWIIDGDDSYQLTKLVEVDGAKPIIKWCDIKQATNPTTSLKSAYGITGDNETDIYNSIIRYNDGGVYLTSSVNKCLIHNSQFIRNDVTYGIHIDGAAASSGDITIEHCDLFQNYAGIYLENNHGTNEIVKNNIYHNNSNEAIKADTAMTISYSVRTDGLENVSDGAAVLFSNPLYLNEGAISEALTDLHIKTIIEGYPTDSPAKDQADDDRNSGSYDVRYIGSATTWTSITIDKPLHGTFGVDYNPVGGNKSVGSEGSIEYTKKGQTLMLTLTYDGMVNDEFDDVLGMWASDESTVRVYPDPVTTPSTYETFKMIREKLKGSAGNYKLTRTGKEGIKLVFERKFEI